MESLYFSRTPILLFALAIFCLVASGFADETFNDRLDRPVLGADIYEGLREGTNWAAAFRAFMIRKGEKLEKSTVANWSKIPPGLFWGYYTDIKITRCPGFGDSDVEDLIMLSYKLDFSLQQDFREDLKVGTDAYPITEAERKHWSEGHEVERPRPHPGTAIWKPGDLPMHGQVVEFIDREGRIRWPFGGNSMFSFTFIIDLNADGVLERVELVNRNVDLPGEKQQTVRGVTITTASIPSKTLFSAIHNFHPYDYEKVNEWTHSISDRDGDGMFELDLGPWVKHERGGQLQVLGGGLLLDGQQGGRLQTPKVTFHWDAEKGRFTGPAGGQGKHWLVVGANHLGDDFTPVLAALEKKGGLNYPLRENPPKDGPKKEIIQPEWIEPDHLRAMAPREAALALAEANRTETHRRMFSLTTVGKAAPEKGSVVMLSSNFLGSDDWGGFQFGTGQKEERVLSNSGPENTWAGLSDIRWAVASLPAEDATWLAQTLWWLDQVRTVLLQPGLNSQEAWNSISIQYAQLSFASEQRNFQSPKTSSPPKLSSNWTRRYDRRVAQSLAIGLWRKHLRAEDRRWSVVKGDARLKLAQALLDAESPLDDWPMQIPLYSALETLAASKDPTCVDSVRRIEKLAHEKHPAGEAVDAKEKRLNDTKERCRDGDMNWAVYHEVNHEFLRIKQKHPFASRRQLREVVAATLKQITAE